MGTSPKTQALALLPALFLGLGLGLLYDLLRPPRRGGSSLGAALLDLFFAFCAGVGAFLLAMSAPGGRTGLWDLALTLLGFLLYLHALSPAVLPLIQGLYRMISNTIRSCKKMGNKLLISAKKIFPNVREWIMMKR